MIKRTIILLLCFILLFTTSFVLAEGVPVLNHCKDILCEQNFNNYIGGVPDGFVQQIIQGDEVSAEIKAVTGNDSTSAIMINNTDCTYKLKHAIESDGCKAIEAGFEVRLSDFDSEKSFYICDVNNTEAELITFRPNGTVRIGSNNVKAYQFTYSTDKWYSISVTYCFDNGLLKANITSDIDDVILYGSIDTAISDICSISFVSSDPDGGEITSFSIDNLLVKGSDPIYPAVSTEEYFTETFDGPQTAPDRTWKIQTHDEVSNAYIRDEADGGGLALVSYGKMMELVKIYSTDASYYMELSIYFADTNSSHVIAARGYEYNSQTLTSEIPIITFSSAGKATVGNGGDRFSYSPGRWYDLKIKVHNSTGALEVTLCDGDNLTMYSGIMSKALHRTARIYVYNLNFSSASQSEFIIDNFSIYQAEDFDSLPKNGAQNVSTDVGEIIINFHGNISKIGSILLNGSLSGIKDITVSGKNLIISLYQLEPGKEYILSFSGVLDNNNYYKNGRIKFKTMNEVYISQLGYRNNTGNFEVLSSGEFSTYFTACSETDENIMIYSALYSRDDKKLLALNIKETPLTSYEKEYELYMELPENNGDYIYKMGVWTSELKPLSYKVPTVYHRPSGAKVLADIASVTPRNSHPRLYVNREGLNSIISRVGREGLYKQSFEDFISKADRLLTEAPLEYNLYDGIRLLAISREIRDRVEILGLSYALTKKEAYAERVYEELANAASFADWNPYHFLDTAEMLAAFAIGYDFCYDYISSDPTKKAVIVNAVQAKGYEPLFDDYLDRSRTRTYKWTLTDQPDNWNIVCNGGGIMAAIAFAEELPEYSEQIFNYALPLLEKAVNRYAPDGAWFEGVSYWHYSTKYFCDILSALNTAAGTDYGFSKISGLDKTGYYVFGMTGGDGIFNFSDCSDNLICARENFYLANIFDDVNLENLQYKFMTECGYMLGFKGLLWYDGDYSTNTGNIALDNYYRDTEVCSMRSSYESDQTFVAFSAGRNDVPHSHLDVGSFVIDIKGQRFACDLGSENYNLQTTYEWEPYRKRAEGHNTLVINPDINPDQNDVADTVINRFDSSDDGAVAVCDMTQAYQDDAKSILRAIKLHNNRQAVLVQDEISCLLPSDVWWFMHTQADVSISDDGKTATLTKGGVTVYARLLSGDGSFSVMDAQPLPTSPQNSSQNANTTYRKLAICFENVENLTIAVEFTPSEYAGQTSQIIPIENWQ